jgi:hypothetical protein
LMKSRRMRWAGHVAQVVDEECLKNFGREIWRDNSEDIGVDGSMRMDLGRIRWEDEWIHLAQDKDHLWALMYTVMNLRVP